MKIPLIGKNRKMIQKIILFGMLVTILMIPAHAAEREMPEEPRTPPRQVLTIKCPDAPQKNEPIKAIAEDDKKPIPFALVQNGTEENEADQ
jgi:hypothetical protein